MSEPVPAACRLPRVLVMMATCNGERYLSEQVDSILGQRDVIVTLRVCDDCSDDGTYGILSGYARNHSNVCASQNEHRLGIGLNFMQMVYEASPDEYDFYAFSDQDDVWLPEKITTAIEAIESAKAGGGKEIQGFGKPVLYCSDLLDVDEHLENPVRELTHIASIGKYRASALVKNRYSGCTMVFDRGLLKLAQLHKEENFYRNHDAWLFLLAYYCGNVVVDEDHALILRRITGQNSEGALFPGRDVRKVSLRRAFQPPEREASKVASQLLVGYGDYMSEKDRALMSSFCSYASSFGKRIRWALSRSYRSLSPIDTLLIRVKFLLGRL